VLTNAIIGTNTFPLGASVQLGLKLNCLKPINRYRKLRKRGECIFYLKEVIATSTAAVCAHLLFPKELEAVMNLAGHTRRAFFCN
jgi:hypothetical protein